MRERGTHNDHSPTGRPTWFEEFLADRSTRKPSPHTLAAYKHDFDVVGSLIAGGPDVSMLRLADLNRDSLRAAFASYAQDHAAASIRRAWSTWNTLCNWLYSSELIPANPMAMVGRPKIPKTLPKALPGNVIDVLLGAIAAEPAQSSRSNRHTWPERDTAIVITALLTGVRLDELVQLDVGAIRSSTAGAVMQVRGKGSRDRRIPVEPPLLDVLDSYLRTRGDRFPQQRRGRSPAATWTRWPAASPLFVGADGQRITRSTVQYRVKRAFRQAGLDSERPPGALVHALRHSFATALADASVGAYQLKALLGHESLATSQRYVDGAGHDTRGAAALNPLYAKLSYR